MKKPKTVKKKDTRKKSKSAPAKIKPVDFAKTPALSPFTLKTKLVESGSRNDRISATDSLSIQIRVYAPHEGRNGLHTSPYLDHAFVVLQGRARFHGPRGETWDVGKHQGIMIPSGAYYSFENSGDDVLVIMRAGSFSRRRGDPDLRVGVNGKPMDSYAPENLRPVDHVDSHVYFE